MKITKFVHSCLLVETQGRTVLFDPGSFSTLDPAQLERLDDIFITHNHGDHMNIDLIKRLVAKFPDVRILATAEAIEQLAAEGIKATNVAPEGVELFDSPHETTEPFFPTPQEHGIHYLDVLTNPGDNHGFTSTKAVLALPMQAPWGASLNAARLALKLKPKYVIPIHDWHWSDAARAGAYGMFEEQLGKEGIKFISTVDGEPFEINV